MVSAISGYNPYSTYALYGTYYASRAARAQNVNRAQAQGAQRSMVLTAHKAAQPETPVQPVTPARPAAPVSADADPAKAALLRFGSDPAEMAVRMRIQYPGDDAQQGSAAQGAEKAKMPDLPGSKGADAQQAANPAAEGSKSAREVMEEGECQTCKERKYQDGSDDPGVSFKAPTNISPDQAAAAVRGHENEHVVREQAKAQREDRKVVSQSVTYHTDICPECGKVYVSGGTTRTVTKANNSEQVYQPVDQQDPGKPASTLA